MYSSYTPAVRLTRALSIQHLLFCLTFVYSYEELRHQLTFDYIPSIFKRSYTFSFKNNFSINSKIIMYKKSI